MMMDVDALLSKIGAGRKLKPAELAEVVELLSSGEEEIKKHNLTLDDIYSLLVVLGKTGLLQYRPLLERYLDSEDALTVSYVLETLCLDWNLVDEYVERLGSFALGNSWDTEDDVRQIALKCLGEYLYAKTVTGDKSVRPGRFLELILGIFDDDESEHRTRQSAYYALLRAFGKPWEEIPSEFARLDLSESSKELDRSVIDGARDIASGLPPAETIPSGAEQLKSRLSSRTSKREPRPT